MLEKSPRTRAFFEHRTVAAYITWLRPIVSTRAAQNWRTLYMYVFRRQRRKKVKLSSKKKKRRDKTFGLTICGTFSMYESQTFLQRISFQFEMACISLKWVLLRVRTYLRWELFKLKMPNNNFHLKHSWPSAIIAVSYFYLKQRFRFIVYAWFLIFANFRRAKEHLSVMAKARVLLLSVCISFF